MILLTLIIVVGVLIFTSHNMGRWVLEKLFKVHFKEKLSFKQMYWIGLGAEAVLILIFYVVLIFIRNIYQG